MTRLKIIAALVSALTFLLLIVGTYWVGRVDGKAICKNGALLTYQEGVKKDANIDKQINRMGEPAIDRALSRWVRRSGAE